MACTLETITYCLKEVKGGISNWKDVLVAMGWKI